MANSVSPASLLFVCGLLLVVLVYSLSSRTESGATQVRGGAIGLDKKYAASHSVGGLSSDQNVKVISTSQFSELISQASNTTRKRKMVDLTKNPETNGLQTLLNTW
jgi:hypothetical protein